MKISRLGLSLTFALVAAGSSFGQDSTMPDIGLRPFGSYFKGDVFDVNLSSGNVYGQIQLASYPQKGKLPPLTFLLNFNSSPFQKEEFYDSTFDQTYYYYDASSGDSQLPLGGVQLTTSYSGGGWNSSQVAIPTGEDCSWDNPGDTNGCPEEYIYVQHYSVTDITGSSHDLLFDSSNSRQLYSADGSGYKLVYTTGTPDDPNWSYPLTAAELPTLYDPNGLTYTLTPSSSTTPPITAVSDPLGNAVQRMPSYYNPNGDPPAVINDSVGHSFPDVENFFQSWGPFPAYSNDTSKCPNLGLANQTPQFTITLELPTVNGVNEPYTLCYTNIAYHTGFYGFDPTVPDLFSWPAFPFYNECTDCNMDPNTYWINTIDGFYAIQSVVLPNNQSWKFIYDATTTTQSGGYSYSSESYGTVSEIIYPTGASQQFFYADSLDSAYTSVSSRQVSRTIANDANGNQATTSYTYSGPTWSARSFLYQLV